MAQEILEGYAGKGWLGDDGVVRFVYEPNAKVAIEGAKKNVEISDTLVGDEKCSLLVDMRQVVSMDKETRTYFSNEGSMVYCFVNLNIAKLL